VRKTKSSYVTRGRSWTVSSSFLRAFVALTKLHEGRPHIDEYKQVAEGDYKNCGCTYYWLIVRIVRKTVHCSLAAMHGRVMWLEESNARMWIKQEVCRVVPPTP
jgi:hypothetical protein